MEPLQATISVATRVPVKPLYVNPTLASDVFKQVVSQSTDLQGGSENYRSVAPPREYGPSAGLPMWVYAVGGLAVVIGGYMLLKR